MSRDGGGNQFLVAYATEQDHVAEGGSGRNSPHAAALAQALLKPAPLLAHLDWVADGVQRQVPRQMPAHDGNLRHNANLATTRCKRSIDRLQSTSSARSKRDRMSAQSSACVSSSS